MSSRPDMASQVMASYDCDIVKRNLKNKGRWNTRTLNNLLSWCQYNRDEETASNYQVDFLEN